MANDNRKTVMAVAAVIVLAGSIFIILRNVAASRPPTPHGTYFYDLTSGELYAASLSTTPPADAPGGAGKGVKAVVAGCGGCAAEQLRPIYLETLTAEAAAELVRMRSSDSPGMPSDALVNGELVALPPEKAGDSPKWVPRSSPEGGTILDRTAQDVCGGGEASICTP